MTKRVFIKSYGCQMNVYDAGRMQDVLADAGYTAADTLESADLVVLNTCHIREKAAEKVFSELGLLRMLKDARALRGQDLTIAVAGCVAQAEGEEILRRARHVDLIVGPQTYHRLPQLIEGVAHGRKPAIDTEFPAEEKFAHLPSARRRSAPSAYLTIQEGCDKFCTFCVVPYTRGAESSRSIAGIEHEARQLIEAGARELVLLGQNVNAYHGEAIDGRPRSLARLISHLSAIPELRRIRYTTSHPNDMSDDLVAAHAENAKLMPYLHLPVQSGSDRILEAMNRRYTVDDFRRAAERVRRARTDIALSSDFIVGFPGETDGDFEATLDLVRETRFASAFSFKYSPRPGTPAASMPDQVPEQIKAERLERLQSLLTVQKRAFDEAMIGTTTEVLIEREGRHAGQMVGRSPYLQGVHIDGAAPFVKAGDISTVEIIGVETMSLKARMASIRTAA